MERLGAFGKVSMCKRVFKEQTQPKGDIPFFKIGTFGKNPDAFISTALYEEFRSKYSYPKVGDILISAAGTIGRTVVFDGTPAYFQDSNIVWIDNDEHEVLNRFLLFCYENTRWTTENTTIARLYNDNLKQISVSLPTLPEQRKIADFLTAVDGRIGQLIQKKALLEDYKKGVMQQLFTQAIRFKGDHGNDFPEWEEKKLGEIATFTKGSGISKAEVHEDGVTPCIRYGELYTHYSELIVEVKSRTNVEPKNLVMSQRNDVIIPASGETHIDIATASCVMEAGIALGGDLNIIRAKTNGVFLAYYLNNAMKHGIARMAQGSSVIHLYPAQLKLLKLTVPSVPEQTKIADFLCALDRKIESVTTQITETQTFKRGLLQQMFV